MWQPHDYTYMQTALDLAEKGRYTTRPNPCVGCVIVKENKIIAKGWHQRAGEPHAERNAINHATDDLKGATCYVTLEPCSHYGRTAPCVDALIEAKIDTVIIALKDPNPKVNGKGINTLEAAGITVKTGLLEEKARELNIGYITRMTKGRPYVRVKMAMSFDGKVAMRNGESKWITSKEARLDAQKLRARSGAIITGVQTILADNPSMTVRTQEWENPPIYDIPSPTKVILDRHLRTPTDANILNEGKVWFFCELPDIRKIQEIKAKGGAISLLPKQANGEELLAMLSFLADSDINDVMIESGPTLAGAFIGTGLVDEYWIYMAPTLLGDEAKGLFHLPFIQSLDDKINLEVIETKYLGQDIRFILRKR